MKKILFVIISALVLGFLIFGLLHQLLSSNSKKGALQVTSTPVSKVYLNNEYIGQTPLCRCEASDTLKAGEYTFKLVPQDSRLSSYQEKITISEGVLTVVDRKFDRESKSSGSVMSLSPLKDKKSTELLTVSIPSKSSVFLDNNEIGQTPLVYKNPTESDHTLRVSKEGYEDKTVRIRTPMGYKLTVIIYLSTQDGQIDNLIPPPATPSATLAPTSALSNTITILETPTGFLRVRQNASVGSSEIGRVTPSEKFELLDEQSGWYQIKLKNGQIGWISSQYASKNL